MLEAFRPPQSKVLLIEDDRECARAIREQLGDFGHQCDLAATGAEGLRAARSEHYDAIILDRMLPDMDGLHLLRLLRLEENRTPTLVISALAEVAERVRGLEAGADDYLGKPFAGLELCLRLEAIVRRSQERSQATTCRRVADLVLDLVARTVRRGNRPISLKPKEYQILEYLTRHPGEIVTRTMILDAVWNYDFDPGTKVVAVHLGRLRRKIDLPGERPLLRTACGGGYRLDID